MIHVYRINGIKSEVEFMMKLSKTSKQILYIFRIYRKTIGKLTSRNPGDKFYWKMTRAKLDGMLDMLLFNTEYCVGEYELVKRYIDKQMNRLYNIYFG